MSFAASQLRFLHRYLEAIQRASEGLPRTEFDPARPSPCFVGEPDAANLIAWKPMRHGRSTVKVPADVAPCLHPDARAWIMDWYRMPIEASLDDETLVLFGAPDDAELEAFLVALTRYAEQNRGAAAAPVAVLHDGRRVIVQAATGAVLLEGPDGARSPVSASLGALLDRLEPLPL